MDNNPVWVPDIDKKTNLDAFCAFTGIDYGALHSWSIEHCAAFWEAIASFFKIIFHCQADNVCSNTVNIWETKWFPGAKLNFAENILRCQDERIALMCYDEQQQQQSFLFSDLARQVGYYAHVLQQAGVKKGSRVVGVLPNKPQAIFAMLATAALGAIWACCSPDFGIAALTERFAQITPLCILASKMHIYAGNHYDNTAKIMALMANIPSVQHVLWLEDIGAAQANYPLNFTPVDFNDPLCILFSSGTSGRPKCIVHRCGGVLIQHLKELGLHCDLQSSDRLLFYTTCGWMMWNWQLSALALGVSLVLYDGAPLYPSNDRLLTVVHESQTTVFGASAAYFAALAKHEVEHFKHKLRLILSTGSPLLDKQYDYISALVNKRVQISSISGGSDIISCFALGNPKVPVYKGELQSLGLGMAVDVFDTDGRAIRESKGELVCKNSFPTMPLGFWGDVGKQRCLETYFNKFPKVWTHGDFAEITQHGGLIIYGRSDATLNPHGVRFGTAELYQVVLQVPGINDCIAVEQAWDNDTRVVLFVQLKPGAIWHENFDREIRATIREKLSARHVPDKILVVSDIPKTANGKVMELAVKKLVNGGGIDNLLAVVNPECLVDYTDRPELKF